MASFVSIENFAVWTIFILYRHLAEDELETITEDKWDKDIWGIEHKDLASQKEIPKLIFYFAEKVGIPIVRRLVADVVSQDHWVADHTRDWLISARGKEAGDFSSSKPIMSTDVNGVGHDFCISESHFVKGLAVTNTVRTQ